jgi:hypothetical protein
MFRRVSFINVIKKLTKMSFGAHIVRNVLDNLII